jgi:hypothetical protein
MLRSHRAPPPLSLPQVDNSNDFHPPLDLQLPPTLAGVAAAVVVVVATAMVAGGGGGSSTGGTTTPTTSQGRGGTPGHPSTTPGPAPLICGRDRPGHCTPSLLHRRWGHCSHLL